MKAQTNARVLRRLNLTAFVDHNLKTHPPQVIAVISSRELQIAFKFI